MGWQFNWVSSNGGAFNSDFHVSFTPQQRVNGEVFYNYGMVAFPQEEAPGVSAFIKDAAGNVLHTYSTFGRGVEVMMGTYNMLDLMPKGRDERDVPYKMEWVRHHDRYPQARPMTKAAAAAAACCSTQA